MVTDKAGEARKGDKLKAAFQGPTLYVKCFPKATMLSGTNMGRGWSTSSAQVT